MLVSYAYPTLLFSSLLAHTHACLLCTACVHSHVHAFVTPLCHLEGTMMDCGNVLFSKDSSCFSPPSNSSTVLFLPLFGVLHCLKWIWRHCDSLTSTLAYMSLLTLCVLLDLSERTFDVDRRMRLSVRAFFTHRLGQSRRLSLTQKQSRAWLYALLPAIRHCWLRHLKTPAVALPTNRWLLSNTIPAVCNAA